VSPLCKGRMVRTVPKMERQSRCFNRRLLQQYLPIAAASTCNKNLDAAPSACSRS
jgi:hypothetical protein